MEHIYMKCDIKFVIVSDTAMLVVRVT